MFTDLDHGYTTTHEHGATIFATHHLLNKDLA